MSPSVTGCIGASPGAHDEDSVADRNPARSLFTGPLSTAVGAQSQPSSSASAGPTRLAAASPDLVRSLVKQSSEGSSPFGRTVLTAPAVRALGHIPERPGVRATRRLDTRGRRSRPLCHYRRAAAPASAT
jgi:hypothetical protein